MRQSTKLSSILSVCVLLAACGGGSGGGNSDGPSGDGSTQNLTFSGTGLKVSGTTIAQNDWLNWPGDLLASLITPGHAALSGLVDVGAGVNVDLIELDEDDMTFERVIASANTGPNGFFEFEAAIDSNLFGPDGSLSSNVIIRIGMTDPLTGPAIPASYLEASNVQPLISPVSGSVVNQLLDRVDAGTSTFDDYSTGEIGNVVDQVTNSLDAQGIVLIGTNSEAAEQVDADVDTLDEDLLDAVKGDAGITLTGPFNIQSHGIELEGDAFPEAIWSVSSQSGSAEVNTDSSVTLDFSGASFEEASTGVFWDFEDDSLPCDTVACFDSVKAQEFESEIGEESASGSLNLTLGSNGQLLSGSNVGAVSGDGEVLAFTGIDTNLFAGLAVAASAWAPNTLDQTFNVVALDGYVDKSTVTVDPSTDVGEVGYTSTLKGEVTLTCAGGSCNVVLDRLGADANKPFVQWSVQGDGGGDGIVTAESSSTGELTLADVSLDEAGVLSQTAGNFNFTTRGLVARDGRMIAIQFRDDDASSALPFRKLVLGVPQGDSCSSTTMDGTYNVVQRAGLFEAPDEGDAVDNTMQTEAGVFTIVADGSGGLDIQSSNRALAEVDTNGGGGGGDPVDNLSVIVDPGATGLNYSVSPACRVTISDTDRDRVVGAISPDGEIIVLGQFHSSDFSDPVIPANTDSSIAIGFRQP